MNLEGKIKVINDTIQVSEKFSKREFVLTDASSMYPQDILFQLTKDKCGILDSHKVGDTVNVHFKLLGREWISPAGEVRYFNSVDAWRIEKIGSVASSPDVNNVAVASSTDDEDLPF